MPDSEKARQKRALNDAIAQILDRDNPHAYSTIVKVEHNIRRFGLSGYFEPNEILSKAYLRGLKAIDQGTQIQNYRAWIKGTAFNIVRELARQKAKEFATDPQAPCLERLSEPESDCEDHCDRNLAILRQALEAYRAKKPEIAELMDWRILEGLSWSHIRNRLRERGGDVPSEDNLRQKATRAKRELRRLFHELGGEYTPRR